MPPGDARTWPKPPAWWLHGSFAACVRLRESHNGADPNAHGNIYGMQAGWAAAGGTGYAGDASRAEQDYRAYRLYQRYGVGPWRPYDGCWQVSRFRSRGAATQKTCPYCWSSHIGPARGSAFCKPEHARRWQAHIQSVTKTRESHMARLLRSTLRKTAT